ncbi:glycosyltransferase [Shewanella sp. Choline-02u-19]|uniref:glycosyltransferase n=1 Tax=unclassified Shewanella TaxID=196818 RepID=UPI000C33F10E|nr:MULTISPECIES: glycosyltransferase [unclassified Shewanella]PKH62383.1 glycosyltransferase [Shewanella sp. Bg11-22]PKI26918.1 glycosyltransferase [Shewanella sp. Choline-02u-19]
MKVLLLGEYSGFHKNLSEGLLEIGVDVVTASGGDGWKQIPSDINWGSAKKGLGGKIERLYNVSKVYRQFEGYDAVQLVSPVILPTKLGINKSFLKFITENNSKTFLLGAGGSTENTAIAQFLKERFKYPQHYQEVIKRVKSEWSLSTSGRSFNDYLLDVIDGYIPIMYEYAQGYRDINYQKQKKTIPIPMNINKVMYRDNICHGKVVFCHGVTRAAEKGSHLIKDAMEKLKRKYPNDVEIHIVGNLPLAEYLKVTARANVIIDQTYSVSYGMNSVYNLALGKVCVGGGETECLNEFGLEDSPLIPIDANVDDIFKTLERILANKHLITDIGYKSRQYAEDVHSHVIVANQFLKTWT